MDFVIDLVIALIATGIVSSVLAWGISLAKAKWSLSPDAVESLELWKEKIVDWVMQEAKDAGADLELPDTRWEWVNKAVDQFIDYIPVLLGALGYSREDLVKEVERTIRQLLRDEVMKPASAKNNSDSE